MPRPITIDLLRACGSCAAPLNRFAELFPAGVVPTIELAERHAHDFTLGGWQITAARLLSKQGRAAFGRAVTAAVRRLDGSFWNTRSSLPDDSPRWPAIDSEFARCCAVAFAQIWTAENP